MSEPNTEGHLPTTKELTSANTVSTGPRLAVPVKTPLTRQGLPPQELLKFAGTISAETLDAIEAAIEEGCGRVESHGQ